MSIANVYKSKNRHRIKKMNKTIIVTNTVINYKLTSHVIKKRTNNKISFIEFVLYCRELKVVAMLS